jgi:glycine betaine transporter
MGKLFGRVDKVIFGVALVVYVLLFLFILLAPQAGESITSIMDFTLTTMGWVYILAYAIIIVIFIGIAISKFGSIRLGRDDERPEHSFFSWIGMLTIAGIGCGLLFFGVNEPVTHFISPPFAESGSPEAARDALRITFLHWSFLPWACYGMSGLCIGYFVFRKGLPGLISSTFKPILGEKIAQIPGKLIDAFSVIAIICGISMSVGFAATQFSTGLEFVYDVPVTFWLVAAVIALIGLLGTLSSVGGIAKGIKIANLANLYMIIAFMVFTFIFGSSLFLLKAFFQGIGDLIFNLPGTILFTDSWGQASANAGFDWVGGWTAFYWAWWVAFAPFVGSFLAKISRGRTIREFVFATVLVPGILCMLWFTLFGGEAIRMSLFEGSTLAQEAAADSVASLFIFLKAMPVSALTIPLALILVIVLIVTSVNSATYEAGALSSGGDYTPSVLMRVFWGVFVVINTVLFFSINGLATLKNMAIVLAFPFIIIMLFMVINLLIDLSRTKKEDTTGACATSAKGRPSP